MRKLIETIDRNKATAAVAVISVATFLGAGAANAVTPTGDADVQSLVTTGISSLKDNALAALVVIIPAAVVIYMAKRSWPLVRKFLHF